ncbi:MAG: glycosyltransferase family 2 protein [Candidatus Saccharimonadales bacterium]
MPQRIEGIDSIEYLIIDDGSTDNTMAVAQKLGVHHIVKHVGNQGLGRSFHDGVMKALACGADIVVNTDGDNQYPSQSIAALVAPILSGEADIVIGDRQTHHITHFSTTKKMLQRLGSRLLSQASGLDIPDAASGFRAYSRESLLRINTVTRFSYCMETIIQAGNKGLAVMSIPIVTNPKLRESRLFKSTPEHVIKSGVTIIRAYTMYKPYMLFNALAAIVGLLGLVPFGRYLYFALHHQRGNHLQSLLVGSILLIAAFLCVALGVIADLVRINRVLQETGLESIKRLRFPKS